MFKLKFDAITLLGALYLRRYSAWQRWALLAIMDYAFYKHLAVGIIKIPLAVSVDLPDYLRWRRLI